MNDYTGRGATLSGHDNDVRYDFANRARALSNRRLWTSERTVRMACPPRGPNSRYSKHSLDILQKGSVDFIGQSTKSVDCRIYHLHITADCVAGLIRTRIL